MVGEVKGKRVGWRVRDVLLICSENRNELFSRSEPSK